MDSAQADVTKQRIPFSWGSLCLGLILAGCASTSNWPASSGDREQKVMDSLRRPQELVESKSSNPSFRNGLVGAVAEAVAGRVVGAIGASLTVDPRALDEPDNVERLIDSAEQYNQSVIRALEQFRRRDQAAAEDAAILATEIHRRRQQRATIVSHLNGKNAERYQATIRVLDELGATALALRESLREKNLAALAAER